MCQVAAKSSALFISSAINVTWPQQAATENTEKHNCTVSQHCFWLESPAQNYCNYINVYHTQQTTSKEVISISKINFCSTFNLQLDPSVSWSDFKMGEQKHLRCSNISHGHSGSKFLLQILKPCTHVQHMANSIWQSANQRNGFVTGELMDWILDWLSK